METKEEDKEDNFPVSILDIKKSDMEDAILTFSEDIQNELRGMVWNKERMGKIVNILRGQILEYCIGLGSLSAAIEDVLIEEISET